MNESSRFPTPSMSNARGDDILRMLTATVRDDADARIEARRRKHHLRILVVSMATASVLIVGGIGYALTQGVVSVAPGGGHGLAAPTSQPSQGVSPMPSPTDTTGSIAPAGTPTATPPPPIAPNDPAHPDSWIITYDGIGPVTIGQTYAQADALLAESGLKNSADCPNGPTGVYLPEKGPGLYLNSGLNPTVGFITLMGDLTADGSAPRSGGPKTPHGIGIGSTTAELKAAYPALVPPLEPAYPGETGYGLTDGDGRWIDFVVNDDLGTVQQITVNTNNELLREYCG